MKNPFKNDRWNGIKIIDRKSRLKLNMKYFHGNKGVVTSIAFYKRDVVEALSILLLEYKMYGETYCYHKLNKTFRNK